MDAFKRYNLTILAIPAFYMVGIIPHMYAIAVATNNQPLDWDNRAPRSVEQKEAIKEKIGEDAYGRYERAEGAMANTLEALPLFASAVIVGNAAGLKSGGWFGLDSLIGGWFALRILHNVAYIGGSTKDSAWAKTAVWAAALGAAFTVFGKAARVLNRTTI